MLRDPQEWDPLPIWEAYHKEVPLLGVPEITLDRMSILCEGSCSVRQFVKPSIWRRFCRLESNEKQKHVNSQKTWDALVVPLGMRWCDPREKEK